VICLALLNTSTSFFEAKKFSYNLQRRERRRRPQDCYTHNMVSFINIVRNIKVMVWLQIVMKVMGLNSAGTLSAKVNVPLPRLEPCHKFKLGLILIQALAKTRKLNTVNFQVCLVTECSIEYNVDSCFSRLCFIDLSLLTLLEAAGVI